MEYTLDYENIGEDLASEAEELLQENFSASQDYTCEYGNCERHADVEWYFIDSHEFAAGEGGYYFSMRCLDHPVMSAEYRAKEL